MASIIIDDGTREYSICNKYGEEICKFHFRPADFSIAERFDQVRDDFIASVKAVEEISVKSDGTAADEAEMAALHDADMKLRQSLNRLLDSQDADKIFETRNPFSVVGGKFFAERVLDAIGQIIKEAVVEETQASAERVSKYIEGGVSDDRGAAENA